MFDQPTLFNVRPTDPETSHGVADLDRSTLRNQVRRTLTANPEGLTDWELTDLLGFEPRRKPSVGKRRQETGAIDSGRRRPSPDGHPCVVWVL